MLNPHFSFTNYLFFDIWKCLEKKLKKNEKFSIVPVCPFKASPYAIPFESPALPYFAREFQIFEYFDDLSNKHIYFFASVFSL